VKIVYVLSYRCPTWSSGEPVALRNRLYFSMSLLVVSIGRHWSAHLMLEFSAMKKNQRIISDIQKKLDYLVHNGFPGVLVIHSECF